MLDSQHFADAIRRVAAGETVVDQELVATLIKGRREDNPLDKLTDREREVLQLMAEGLTDRGIGECSGSPRGRSKPTSVTSSRNSTFPTTRTTTDAFTPYSNTSAARVGRGRRGSKHHLPVDAGGSRSLGR